MFFFILFYLFVSNTSIAQSNTVELKHKEQDFVIPDSSIYYLKSNKKQFSFDQVKTYKKWNLISNDKNFSSSKEEETYWIKFSIAYHIKESSTWILQIPLHTDLYEAYVVNNNICTSQFNGGQAQLFSKRDLKLRTQAFQFIPNSNGNTEIYLKIYSPKHSDFSFVLSTLKTYTEVHTIGYLILGITYGILFLMIIYNVVLFFSIKEKIYIYYICYTLSAIFFLTWKDGLGFQFLWPSLPVINAIHYHVGLFLLLISFLIYANHFLELREKYIKLYYITYLIIVVNSIYFLLTVVDTHFFEPLPYVYILSYIYFLGLCIFYAQQKFKPARYLLISLVSICSALIIIKLRYLGILDWNWFFEYILNYAIIIEVVAMSFAIRDKLMFLHSQKEQAKEHQLKQERLKSENELISLKNKLLEQEIISQNNELSLLAGFVTQKSDHIEFLKKELSQIAEQTKDNITIKKLIRELSKENQSDNHWEQFQINFNKAHQNYLLHLGNKHPKLKPADLLLCAYIKLGKSNKEMSELMNISISGVEKKRLRLREKLDLSAEQSLKEYLYHFQNNA